jgi:hypothetical protein
MWKLILITITASLASAKLQTAIVTAGWSGGWCSINTDGADGVYGNYACGDGQGFTYGNWNNGYISFQDPVPTDNVVVKVSVTLKGQWGCSDDASSSITTRLQNTTLGSDTVTGICQCDKSDEPRIYTSDRYSKTPFFPKYNYGGTNTLYFNVTDGIVCLSDYELTITYKSGTVPYQIHLFYDDFLIAKAIKKIEILTFSNVLPLINT